MYNSKKTAVALALALMSLATYSQTIGDIAAHQRAKAQAQLKGEVMPDGQGQATSSATPVPQDIPKLPKPIPVKPLQVLATYEVDGISKALISNQGSATPVGIGDKVNQYKIYSITAERVGFQPACKKAKSSKSKKKPVAKCKVIGVNVGGSL